MRLRETRAHVSIWHGTLALIALRSASGFSTVMWYAYIHSVALSISIMLLLLLSYDWNVVHAHIFQINVTLFVLIKGALLSYSFANMVNIYLNEPLPNAL